VNKIISISHPKSVLDVGCAYGYIVKRLRDKGIYAIGMDISEWCSRQRIIPDYYVRHDMRVVPYPFKDKEFDLLYCEGVLEHIGEEYIEGIMKEFERVSERRLLQLSFDWHKNVEIEPGHINVKHHDWWFERVPLNTWLALDECATERCNKWLYKG